MSIPDRMARRPKDRRGYPIPFANWIKADGEPDFRILDQAAVGRCIRYRLCGLCGERMGSHVFFIGGDSCVRFGVFYDPPMHRDCAIFALATCPHLARIKGSYSLAPLPVENDVIVQQRDMAPDKAERFALMHAHKFTARFEKGGYVIEAARPWIGVCWYRDGQEIIDASTLDPKQEIKP